MTKNQQSSVPGKTNDPAESISAQGILNLPSEIDLYFMEFLPAKALATLAQVCKTFNILAGDEHLWNSLATQNTKLYCPLSSQDHKEELNIEFDHFKNQDEEINFFLERYKNVVDKNINSLCAKLKKTTEIGISGKNISVRDSLLNDLNELIIRREIARNKGDYLAFFNAITRFPATIIESSDLEAYWKKLNRLNLENNNLKILPDNIGKLTSLTALSLSYNKLTELPSSIGNLSMLVTVDIAHNNFIELPDFLQKLNLKSLHVTDNRLSSIPTCFENIILCERIESYHCGGIIQEYCSIASALDLQRPKESLETTPFDRMERILTSSRVKLHPSG